MKKIVLFCLINLLIHNVCFCQNTYPKTLGDTLVILKIEQVKEINQIFLEHQKLLTTDSIYKKQIASYKEAINESLKLDSLQNDRIIEYSSLLDECNKSNKKFIKKYNFFRAGFFGSTAVAAILFALLL